MLLDVAVFLVSLVFLAKASHTVLKSSVSLSRMLGIGEFAIGFILIAVATSLPELFVSIVAGLNGDGGIIIGNVIGSNITNTLLVLGLTAVIATIFVDSKEIVDNAQILFIVSLIPLVLLQRQEISGLAGGLLIVMFFVYAFLMVRTGVSPEIDVKGKELKTESSKGVKWLSVSLEMIKTFCFFAAGIVVVVVSSNFLVGSAVNISISLGINQTIIGLTIIALGTSIPELAIGISAMLKKHKSIALGEILGSSVVNLTLVLGTGAALTSVPTAFDVIGSPVILLVCTQLFLWLVLSRLGKITRNMGLLFVVVYCIFILSQFTGTF
ncbi:MAG: sodium:calcium antiporter [Candidatus Diapherotrites archaeon]